MFGKKQPDVLVVGAGPVGLTAALVLARRGVRVKIVDEAWRPTTHAYALALHPQALDLLERLELAGPVLDKAVRVHGLGVYAGSERMARLDLSRVVSAFPFVVVLRQSALEELLVAALSKHHVEVEWNHRLARLSQAPDHVDVTIDKLEKDQVGYAVMHTSWCVADSHDWKPSFVIGADGHASLVRRRLEVDFPEVARAQHFAVFEFGTDYDFEHELRIVLRTTDANVVWPLPEGRCRWSFELPGYDDPDDPREKTRHVFELGSGRYPMLEEKNLYTLLEERAPWFDGRVEEIDWRLVVRFERRLATSFGRGRVWLAGDAGHMTSPVGIQSMNVGMREVDELANLIADELGGAQRAEGFTAYGNGRLEEWRRLLGLDGRDPATDDTPRWLRPFAQDLVPALPASGSGLAALAHQLGLRG